MNVGFNRSDAHSYFRHMVEIVATSSFGHFVPTVTVNTLASPSQPVKVNQGNQSAVQVQVNLTGVVVENQGIAR